jgi:hypothetical protein
LKNSNSNAFKSESFDHLTAPTAYGERRPSEVHDPKNPLKNVLQHRKRNQDFRHTFRLPEGEEVVDEISVCYMFESEPSPTPVNPAMLVRRNTYHGTLYQSQNFLAFQSTEVASMTEMGKSHYSFILPLYTITKFERINNDAYKSALCFRTWHKMEHILKVDVSLNQGMNLSKIHLIFDL